ncbi:MAG: D-glycerate dehydrogenase [Chloroflexi bacterium]|nr:D-glycerate dehydrogenase [Chloroflexota bacterium]
MIPEAGLERIRQACEVRVWEDELPPPRDVLRREVAGVEGVLSLLSDQIDAEIMDVAPNLKVISNMAVGFDNIDTQAATQRGIPVGHTPGALTETTADFAFALLMAAARRISEAERYVRAGQWKTWGPMLLMGQDIYGATLGIIGLGRIGQAVARRARGFDMRVIYNGGSDKAARELGAEARSFEEVLAESDFLSLHTPLKPETRHLIDAEALRKMKPTSVLINTARGPVVDQRALYEALASGTIAYAALDVTDPEPIPLDDPLLTLDNCLIAPHIASSSVRTRTQIALMAAENLLAGLEGRRLPHCANPLVYNE